MSRISKVKDCSQRLQRRRSVSPQMVNMKLSQQTVHPAEFHQKEMPNRTSPGLKSVRNLTEQRSGMEDSLKKTVALQDDDLSSNDKGKVKALTTNNSTASLKTKHSVGVMRNYGKTNCGKSSGSALAQSKESVGFKKVNDHIVKISEKNCTNYSQKGEMLKYVSLADEVMESLAFNDSPGTTSSEDGPSSQSHQPSPHYLSRHTDHKDQSLDLSDGDYASDAPSETRFNEEHQTSTPTSSSSSFSSDSELKSLQRSMANCKKTHVERLFWNGCRVITFRNGTKKEIGVDKSVTVTFFNGDVKRTLADGTVNTNMFIQARNFFVCHDSTEKHHPDGTREISFPDGTIKILYADGREESIFPDGTVVKISQHGEKVVEFTNGQREIHTSQYKRRMYPDGTVKTVYTNGRQETKFSSGRVRIKNNEGIIIMDKK
ncbi:centromere J-like protein [Labeo rohita]|uniref:Centromere J-like protein n=1 Tax=Labeo rohita TaxID=84645 RepID=A0A498MR52_LABRO|nr:centromere J-like protein [Labeo rohita]